MGDVLILIPQEGCLIIFRTATINIESSIFVCAENILWPWHLVPNMRRLHELSHTNE
jgi:hypothetical protein